MINSDRRRLLALASAAAAGACASTVPSAFKSPERKRTILLRSSWQTENIGDVAHTPGFLALVEAHLPNTDVILWPEAVDHGVAEMLHANFPRLQIVHGTLNDHGEPIDAALKDAFATADLFVHGSGSGLPGGRQVQAWRQCTRKPFGIFGVSLWNISTSMKALLDGAAFVFCRDTLSLANARKASLHVGTLEFGPDAAFGMKARDESRAANFMRAHQLREKGFLCVVPRLRQTPYEEIRRSDWTDAEVQARSEENERFVATDHAKLRDVIEQWVGRTGQQVLLCPEMTYQLRLLRPWLYDPLPEDVKRKVVMRRTFWFPDEAAATYAQASAVVSVEMHSAILALMSGTQAFYVQQPSDTIKGQMWRDIGLGDWLINIDKEAAASLADTVIGGATDCRKADAEVAKAQMFVQAKQALAMRTVGNALG